MTSASETAESKSLWTDSPALFFRSRVLVQGIKGMRPFGTALGQQGAAAVLAGCCVALAAFATLVLRGITVRFRCHTYSLGQSALGA